MYPYDHADQHAIIVVGSPPAYDEAYAEACGKAVAWLKTSDAYDVLMEDCISQHETEVGIPESMMNA
jgi:adenosyl cobinamide kinase/adenosyl cobinamide phosphate guanylyltransferase